MTLTSPSNPSATSDLNPADAARRRTRADYRRISKLRFRSSLDARRAVRGIVLRGEDLAFTPADRAFHKHVAANLYAKIAIAAAHGRWGTPREEPHMRERMQDLYREAIDLQSALFRAAKARGDVDAANRYGFRVARWTSDFALDLSLIGIGKSAADELARQAFVRAARAYGAFAEVAATDEARAVRYLDAAVAAECAATRARLAMRPDLAAEHLGLADQYARASEQWFGEAVRNATDPLDRVEWLSARHISVAYRFALALQQGDRSSRARSLLCDERRLRRELRAYERELLAEGHCDERELLDLRVLQGARIVNRINAGPNRTRADSELTNCQRVVVCGLAFTSGVPIVAPARTPGTDRTAHLKDVYEAAYGGTFAPPGSAAEVVAQLRIAGSGAKGIVSIRRGAAAGHVTMAMNAKGSVHFLEFQSGTLKELSDDGLDIAGEKGATYSLLLTHDPRRPETMLGPVAEYERAIGVLEEIERSARFTRVPPAPTAVPATPGRHVPSIVGPALGR